MMVGEDTDVLAQRIAKWEGADANEWDRSPSLRSDAEGNILMGVARNEDEKYAIGAHLSGRKSL